MTRDVTIRSNALTKMLLHAAKYPHAAVNGVVLAQPKGKDSASELVILDAVPLFHQQLNLTPMLEIALLQVEKYYKAQGLVISGYYQANEHIKDNVPDYLAVKVAEKIAENNDNTCLIMIDNKKMSMHPQGVPISVSLMNPDGKWKNREKTGVHVEAGSLEIYSEVLEACVQRKVYDYDNHLDDLTCDWANPEIDRVVNILQKSELGECDS